MDSTRPFDAYDGSFASPWILAQDGVSPDAGATTSGSGAPLPDPGTQQAAPPSFFPFVLFGLIGVMLLLTLIGPRKEKKRRAEMMNALKKHDRVQTVGGVIGSITEIKPDTVVLKVDESSNTRITFSKTAIQQVLAGDRSGD